MMNKTLIETLRRQAAEIADEGRNSWGNTMLGAAEALEASSVELARLRAFRDFFNDECGGLYFLWGMEAVDLYNATEPYSHLQIMGVNHDE